jgi:hypothetical protein
MADKENSNARDKVEIAADIIHHVREWERRSSVFGSVASEDPR